jgi:hypothetical protein
VQGSRRAWNYLLNWKPIEDDFGREYPESAQCHADEEVRMI